MGSGVKHLAVAQKSTFERFKPIKPARGMKIYKSNKVHICRGELRKMPHVPTVMRHSGFAQSGGHRIARFECGACGLKTTFGVSG